MHARPRYFLDVARPRTAALRLLSGRPPRPTEGAERTYDDAELVRAIADGHEEAANAVFERLRPRVDVTVRRLLGRADPDVDDCVQDALVEIVRSIHRYRAESSLEHWASTVAAHVVYKHIRRRKVERRVFERAPGALETTEASSVVRKLEARSLVDRLRARLADVGPDKLYAFLLHDVLGFDLREISHITGASVAASQQRLVRGRREVHARIHEDAELASALTKEDGKP